MLTISYEANGKVNYEFSEGATFNPYIPRNYFYAPSDPTGKRKEPALIMGRFMHNNRSVTYTPQIVVYEDTPAGVVPYAFCLDSINDIFTDIDLSSYGYKRMGVSRWIKRQVND